MTNLKLMKIEFVNCEAKDLFKGVFNVFLTKNVSLKLDEINLLVLDN